MRILSLLVGLILYSEYGQGIDKVIYGQDGRVEVRDLKNRKMFEISKSVAAQISKAKFEKLGDKFLINFANSNLGKKLNLCKEEKFRNQPSLVNCSGFLYSKNEITTAGHCFSRSRRCESYYWVFDFNLAMLMDLAGFLNTSPSDIEINLTFCLVNSNHPSCNCCSLSK